MIASLEHIVLFARRTRISDMGGRFRKGGSSFKPEHLWYFLAFMAVLFLFALIVSRIAAHRNKPGYASPFRLFRQLCKAHKLRPRQQWLLWRLARWQRLQHPASLFLEPARFDPANLGPALKIHKDRFREIHDHIMVAPNEKLAKSNKRGKKKVQTKSR